MARMTRAAATFTITEATEAARGQMSEAEMVKLMGELMAKWNEMRAAWLTEHGNDDGFGEWFTAQLGPAVTA